MSVERKSGVWPFPEQVAAAVRAARDFDEATRRLQVSASMSQEEVARLRERVLQMARQSPTDSPLDALRCEGDRLLRERGLR